MTRTISRTSVACASAHQVSSDFVDGEVILLDVQEGTYYGLNPVGATIWRMIQTPTSVGEIIDALLETYDVSESRCVEEVSTLLRNLVERNLVEITDGTD